MGKIEELEQWINQNFLDDIGVGIDTTMDYIGEMSLVDTSEIPMDVAGKLDIPIETKKKLRFTLHRKSRDKPVSEKTDFQLFLHPEPSER